MALPPGFVLEEEPSKGVQLPPGFQLETAPAAPAVQPKGGFIPAIQRGALQTGSLIFDILPAMAGRLVGADEYAEKQFAEAAETERKIQEKYAAAVPSYKDIKGVGDAITYLTESVGELVPSILPSLVTGGIAGIAGRGAVIAAKEAAEAAARKKVAEQGAEALAKKEVQDEIRQAGIDAARRTALKYDAVGIVGGSSLQNIPEVYKNIKDETEQESIGTAILFGGFNSLLDAALPLSILTKLRKAGIPEEQAVGAWVKRFGTGFVKNYATESATEAAQEMSSAAAEKFVDENQEFFSEKNLERFLNAGLKGGLGGGVVGGTLDVVLGKKSLTPELKDLGEDIRNTQSDILARRAFLDELRAQADEEGRNRLNDEALKDLGLRKGPLYDSLLDKDINNPVQAEQVKLALAQAIQDPTTKPRERLAANDALNLIGEYQSTREAEPDVGQVVETAGGEGVPVPVQPAEVGAAAPGIAGVERTGVVPPVADVAEVARGEGLPPAPVEAPVEAPVPEVTPAPVSPAPAPELAVQPAPAPAEAVVPTTRELIAEQETAIAKQMEKFQGLLQEQVKRYGLKDVGVKVIDDLKNANGMYSKGLIQLAVDTADPVRALKHESVHALKELGFFTPAQWQSLVKQANTTWVNTYMRNRDVDGNYLQPGQRSRYDAYIDLFKRQGLDDAAIQESLVEEAIADAFGDFAVAKEKPGMIRALINRMKNFFQSIKESVGLAGIPTSENIFGKIAGGRLEPVVKRGAADEAREPKQAIRAVQPERPGERGGREEVRGLAPLEGAPSVPGFSGPDPRLVEVAERYAKDNGISLKRQSAYAEVDEEFAKRIAQAYEEMPHAPSDPAVREAYENMIRQTRAQYDALVDAGYKFWFIDLDKPSNVEYASTPWNAMRDIRANKEMGVFPTNDGFGSLEEFSPEANPLLADTGLQWPVGGPDGEPAPVLANDLFRAVHDAFGHGLEGAGFRARGEENAWQAHRRLFTGSAVGALTSETRGQNSWLNYGPYGEKNRNAKVEDTVFADQKTGLMPEWTWQEKITPDELAEVTGKFSLRGEVPLSTRTIMEANDEFARAELGLNVATKRGIANKVRDIGIALNEQTLREQGKMDRKKLNLLNETAIAKAIADEVAYQLTAGKRETGTGLGWYSNNYPRAVKRLGNRFPELATNRHARSVFTALVAVTSNGEKVNKNIDNAITLYSKLRSGKPLVAMGNRRATALENNLQVIQDLLAKHGTDFEKVLKQEITVKDMNAQLRAMGEEPDTSYLYNTVVPAAAVYFGPKLGAFYANLSGSEGYLTMDLWWTRSINRMRGLLIPRATDASIEKFRDMIGDPSMDRDDLVAATIPLRNKYEEFGYNTELEHLVGSKEPSKKGAKPAWFTKAERAAGPAYDQLLYDHNLEKMANTIYKNEFEGLEEAPFTANDRDFMYRAARRAQGILRGEGIDLTLADIQAALWYYEKRLYEKLSGRKADDIGYEEAIIAQSKKADRREGPSVVFPERDGGGDVARGEVAGATEVRGEPAQTEPTEVTPPKFSISGPRLTPELRQAAQGSAIVDADGNLIPMYHGTAAAIRIFRPKQAGATFVSPDPAFASGYTSASRMWMVKHIGQFLKPEEIRKAVQELRQSVYEEYGKQSKMTIKIMDEIHDVLLDAKQTGVYNFKGELQDKWYDLAFKMIPGAKERVMELYVLAKRPFDFENKADVNAVVKKMMEDPAVREFYGYAPAPLGVDLRKPENFMLRNALKRSDKEYKAAVEDKFKEALSRGSWTAIETPPVQKAIRALNFDSFYVIEGGTKNLGVYDPRLIKSADENVGPFGQRPPTKEEAERLQMTEEEALRAQEEGDIRFSLRAPKTEAFKSWFGDSKVVDANGEPLVVYHGTTGDFDSFEVSKQDPRDAGFWFGGPSEASSYAAFSRPRGENVMPVFLSIKNPKVYYNRDVKITPELIKQLKSEGYDGVMRDFANGPDAWRYGENASPEWAAFYPEQVKSATGNIGTFEPTSPDIRFSLRSGRWTDKRIESLISSNMYTQSDREGDTKGYAAFIRPSDFLDATTTRDYRERLEQEREPLRREELADLSPIGLIIRRISDDEYEITEHNGRHRMMALRDAGIEEVPVYLELFGRGHEKNAKPKSVYLRPQSFGSQSKAIAGIRNVDMTPLSWEYRDEVKQKFGGEGEVKFSLRGVPTVGINVASDTKTGQRYADLIVDGSKTYESRNTDSLRPYVGQRVAIVRTGEGPAKAIGAVTIGEPIRVNKQQFRRLEGEHLVPAGSKFDIVEGQKYLYPLTEPERFTEEYDVGTGIVARKVEAPPERASLRSQVDPAITARMLQTTTARDQKGYVERITDSIGPESRSRLRAAALNRYNRLGEADKLKLARMGGADLYADANAESAALLSDLASGIVAGALGVYDKIGGVPVYNRYYVVEKQVMGPQGMQFIPIGGKITSRQAAEALARRQGGEVKERGYVAVTNKDNTIKGPLAIFAPLAKYGDPDIYRYYQFWAGVKRGEKWMTNAQGQVVKERLFEQPDVQKAEQLRQQFLKEGIDFEKIQKEWTAYNDELVQFMLDTGVLSQKQADEYRKHGDYLPFYRQIQGDDDAVGPRIFQPISAVKQPRKLKGGEDPLGDFLENMVRNTQSAVQAGMKNIAARRAADVGMDVGMVDKVPAGAKPDPINSFYVLENGEKVYYDTKDALFIESIKSLGLPEFPGIGLLSGPANVLRNLVTKDPGFMLANMMRDSLSAWTTSGVNMMPIAATLKNFTDAIAGQSPEFRALQMAGVIGGYDYSQGTREATEQFGKELRRTAGAQTAGEKAMRPFTYLWEGLEKGTQASDAATRIEVYKATLKETGNEAEALFRALEVMNFNRKGNNPIVRVATAAIPFLNARMQGLDVLYRAAFGKNATKNAAEIQKAFWVRGMTMAALSTMYWMLTHDEEEYKRQEQETRDNNWLFPSLGIRVPIPFEVGVLFKVVPERIAALTLGDDTAKDFTMSMGRNLANSLLANPIPQVALPLIESATNFSFFTLRPIVGQGLEGVAPAYQVGPGTSRLAEALGKATNLSPMKIDQILQGYTGTIGQYMSDLIDTVWDMHTDNPKASKRFEQLPVIKRFALDPDARGQVTAYFDLKNSADEATRTANLLERSMNYEEYGKYMTENIKMFAFKDYILDLDKTLKDYRDMKNMIRSLPMDADQKRDSIRAITQIENQMTTNIQLLKKQMQ